MQSIVEYMDPLRLTRKKPLCSPGMMTLLKLLRHFSPRGVKVPA